MPFCDCVLLYWQAYIVLRKRGGLGARTGHVVEFGQLQTVLEKIGSGEGVQHRSHPPREACRLPDSAQRSCRVLIEQIAAIGFVVGGERAGENLGIACREVESLGAGGWHDMG